MNADHYYAIGSTHVVCEDYARSGKTKDGRAYAIVCDGCSSSPDTDVGARIVGLKAEKFVKKYSRIPDGVLLAYNAREKVEDLGLASEAMDATLIIALENEDRRFIDIAGWGDGGLICTSIEGDWQIDEWNYDPNYPFYLSYLADPERLEAWNGSGLGLTHSFAEARAKSKTFQRSVEAEGWTTQRNMFDGRFLFIVTDGLSSFEDKDLDPRDKIVPSEQIAEELIKVKFPKGKFVTKRARRLLKNFRNNGIVNTDDFGVAGICNPVG